MIFPTDAYLIPFLANSCEHEQGDGIEFVIFDGEKCEFS